MHLHLQDEAKIIRSPWPDVTIPETNLADYVWQNVDQYEDNTAVVCGMTGRYCSVVAGTIV